ncbi:SDR family NAD(P)-dependent oxidoreductase [Arthrobacter sp. NA-172]|uniref:SDR family NAD(P)-dependent oxidoreductase n=1 Tax=Arthrobacter sp. NA-172 TaxID=3367524 RepID=UPI003754EB33
MKLDGRKALVTGASGGLGSAIALGLAREGADVALHGNNQDALTESAERVRALGRRAVIVTGDVGDFETAQAMTDRAAEELGGLDILVNNAGITSTSPFLTMPFEEWERVMRTNVSGYFAVGQAAARHMSNRGAGAIINVSSTRERQLAGSTAYCSSKGAISMLTRCMAMELAPYGIRVNGVAPGTIVTGLNRSYALDEDFRTKRLASIPLGRYGETDEVAGAVVFLASDEASFMVGASLFIDGGQALG